MISLADVSLIVPIAAGDSAWQALVPDLLDLPFGTEVIFVCPRLQPEATRALGELAVDLKVRWLTSESADGTEPTRARQLNTGARAAVRPYLWFVHADSRFTPFTLQALQESLNQEPGALHYFDLEYSADGPELMRLNEIGAWWRSRALGWPAGDQAFCVARDIFNELGGFAERAREGEDQDLVWRAHRAGVPVRAVGAPIRTSPRAYSEGGWARTTVRRQLRELKQAMPAALQLAGRAIRRRAEKTKK